MFATVPSPVVYEQTIFTVKVHCAAAAPQRCEGDVALRFKGKDLGSTHYRVPPGATRKARLDLGEPVKVTRSDHAIEVSLDGATYVKRRLLVRTGGGGAAHTDFPLTHVVKDRRGDGAGPLDLRRAEAHVRNHRLIITWVCWGTVTPAKMDHDVAGFDAEVYTRKPYAARKQHASVFWADHGPVLFAGSELGPNDWGGRFYRPSSHAVRMSIPLRRFGRRVRQLWIMPATYATRTGRNDRTRGTIHFRIGG